MKIPALLFRALFILSLGMIPVFQAYAQDGQGLEEETILVGRISHIQGELLRYDPEIGDWVVTVKDSPFGVDDILLTSVGGRAEIIMPNNTWARIDGDTQIQLIAISADLTEVDLASGKARLYNKSSDTEIKASTPFGYVMAPAETTFDFYVGERDMEVIALEGTVYFVHNASDTRHEVIAGSSVVYADIARVAASEGSLPPGWHAWNKERDLLWAKRMQAKGESANYLPPSLHEEAYVLEKYGRWENVYYDGAYYHFWRPVHISVGWAPFTVGRWSMWCGDHVWLPYEPFGYLTHHYGNWIFIQGSWYWAPPVTGVMAYAGLPLLEVGFSWYPGRVGWIYSGAHVGWIPLAPYEPYYGYRRWGRYSFAVASKKLARFHFNIHKYRHRRHAVIIHRNHFYRVNNYNSARVRGISHDTVVNRYRMAPVINRAVKKDNYRAIQKRRRLNNVHVRGRPNTSVAKRKRNTQSVRWKRPEVSVNKNRQTDTHYSRTRPVENAGKNSPKYKGREIRNRQVDNPMPAPLLEEKRRRRDKRPRAEDLRKAERQMRRSPDAMVRKGGKRNVPITVDKAIEKSERRKGPEIVRPHRVRQEKGSVKVIEIQNRRVRRFDAPEPQTQQVRQKRREEQRPERRIARTDRPMLQRKPNQSSVQKENRGRSEWRGNRSSVFSQPRANARGYPSGHAKARSGKRRFSRQPAINVKNGTS
jgi:hypothetical protein